MKFLDRLVSFIFDLFVIVLAVSVLLVTTSVINQGVLNELINEYVFNPDYRMIVISVAIIVILLGLKITVFSSTLSSKAKKNILVDTPHGKIQIAQETIETIAKNVISNYSQVKDVQARMTKASKGINMYMVLIVNQDTNIKDIVTKVQNDVKQQIESTTSVSVKNVDVKIRNVVSPKASDNINEVKNEEKRGESVKLDTKAIEQPKTEADGTNKVQDTNGYMKDENDVLYKVEPNPNSPDGE